MSETLSEQVRTLLAGPVVHTKWEGDYRTPENEAFYELAFDEMVRRLRPPRGSVILDAGCGPGFHTLRLARRGFRVESMDFSATAVELARANVERAGLSQRVHLRQGSLLELPFATGRFPYILCWGVLMHVPEVERAVGELARVLAPGGKLVISESNMFSVQSLGLRLVKRLARGEKAEVIRKPAGLEFWATRDSGKLLTRETDPAWLVRAFRSRGVILKERRAGQLTELYTRVSTRPLQKLVHLVNRIWFQAVKLPGPAFGNLFFFHKPQ
jgi:2-polyprenyl-3-methyl-5-hydroxy-6-metoxy-1,4-benzoquinol methylase